MINDIHLPAALGDHLEKVRDPGVDLLGEGGQVEVAVQDDDRGGDGKLSPAQPGLVPLVQCSQELRGETVLLLPSGGNLTKSSHSFYPQKSVKLFAPDFVI